MKLRTGLSCVIGLGLLALGVLSSGAAETGAERIVSRTLDNGMKIIVWPDHDIPNVAMYNWVRAGGRNEAPGISGLSHFFEHMMFNGTSRRSPGAFDREMEANGGSNNAYTSADVTVYQDWFPSAALEVIFDLEGDRLANLSFDPAVIESERGVVTSERRSSVDNSNFGVLYEQVRSSAYIAHPYHIPVIGWPSDIAAWTVEDLRNYFTTYYAPNNCTMIFVGDVTPEQVFGLADTYFAPIPAQEPPPAVRTQEPEQLGERRLMVHKPVQTPLIAVAYKSPQANAEQGPALDLLIDILGGGESSRLYRALVETNLAISIDTFRHEGFDPGLTWFFLTLPQGGDPDAVEARLYSELEKVIRDGVTDAELAKARRRVVADFWRGLSTINGKASALGQYEIFHGDYAKLFDVPKQYAAIDAQALRDVASDVFNANRRTVGQLIAPVEQEQQP
ncbi:MAG: M16 family metallopeptidase [Gammaproteobacteria bacterium]